MPPLQKKQDPCLLLKLNVPKDVRGKGFELPITTDDFNLTWLKYFKNNEGTKDGLYQKVSANTNGFEIRDNREPKKRKSWKLTTQISQFINSFSHNKQEYRATLMHVTASAGVNANSRRSPQQPVASTSRATGSPSKQIRFAGADARPLGGNQPQTPRGIPVRNGNITSPKRNMMNGNGPERPAKTARNASEEINMRVPNQSRSQFKMAPVVSFLNIDMDDAASMANTIDSQDSQEDLIQAGVQIENIRPFITQNFIKHMDNNTMLRIRLELQKLKDEGKWLKASARAPLAFNMLQLMFNIQ